MTDLRWKHAIESGLIKMPEKPRMFYPPKGKGKAPEPIDDRYTTRGELRKAPVGHPGAEYYTADEAMARLLVSRPTLCRLAIEGHISYVKRQVAKGAKCCTTCAFYLAADVEQLRCERREEGKL